MEVGGREGVGPFPKPSEANTNGGEGGPPQPPDTPLPRLLQQALPVLGSAAELLMAGRTHIYGAPTPNQGINCQHRT